MGQDKLEAFMLMAIEQDILESISIDEIIDFVATKSSTLTNMLVNK